METDKNFQIDNVDRQILSLLLENAQMPYTEIAKKLFVSSGTVHVRMKKMVQAGIVTGSQLNIDHTKLGYDLTAFLGIYLVKSSYYDEVLEDNYSVMLTKAWRIYFENYFNSILAKARGTEFEGGEALDKLKAVLGQVEADALKGEERTYDLNKF